MKYLLLVGSALAVATSARAEDATHATSLEGGERTEITVLATGTQLDIDKTGQPISVIGTAELQSIQGSDVARVLERLPGVTFARYGGVGGTTSVFVRGANSQQVLVLVDGIRVADVAAPGGGYDFANTTAGGVGRVELLRGSNSVIWGSEAIGGVISLTSREVNGVETSAEYGARDTFDGQLTAGLSTERYGVTLNGGYLRTDGFSQAANGAEADGFRQWRANGRARYALTPDLTATLTGRYTQGTLDIDGYPAPLYVFGDTPEYQKTRELGGHAGLAWSSDALDLNVGYQVSDTRRRYYDPRFTTDVTSETQGQSRRAELRGTWRAAEALRLDFGADHEWTRLNMSSEPRRTASLSSGHAMLGWYSDAFTVSAGMRYDDHSRFGDRWTFGTNGSLRLTNEWRLRASYGEGFKVPTLYQLFSEYGNEALTPERSRSYDAGVEYGNRNGALHLALTGFRRDSRDLIGFVSCAGSICETRPFGYYVNIGRARASGFELELGARMSRTLRGQAVYTYVRPLDRSATGTSRGNDLARRPRHALTASLDWTPVMAGPLNGLAIGGDVRLVSESYDDPANLTRLPGHVLATLRASVPVNDKLELFGRIENLGNESYQTVSGYGTAGRSGFVGVRARI